MKSTVEMLARYLTKELEPHSITTNVVAPGATGTDFGSDAVRNNANLSAMVTSNTTLGRAGLPGDIGGVVTSLLSLDNR